MVRNVYVAWRLEHKKMLFSEVWIIMLKIRRPDKYWRHIVKEHVGVIMVSLRTDKQSYLLVRRWQSRLLWALPSCCVSLGILHDQGSLLWELISHLGQWMVVALDFLQKVCKPVKRKRDGVVKKMQFRLRMTKMKAI